ncbi:MAG: Glutathione-regulated potassium-efflux system protein KefC [Anaerolineae bacterium]|nr:Glutathione-regulated potassium-efflux system protein KefC [Anaerolineae bacterium]
MKNIFAALNRVLPAYDPVQLAQRVFKNPLLAVVGLLLFMVTFGTLGYMVIEGWSLLDSLYMTAITLSTIGYGEVKTLSPSGRIFTIALIFVGVATASYAATVGIELFTSERFLTDLRNRRRRRILQKISDHCIICGFGRMGSSLAAELQSRGTNVVAIDLGDEAIERCQLRGLPAIQGNAADDRILREAGIERASSLVAATKSDAENVFIILTAKSINPNLHIFSRCNSEASIPKLQKAGAETVISPYTIAGKRIAHMITHPNVTSFLDGVLEFGGHQMRLEEFVVGQNSVLAGQTLREARLNAVVLAVDHPGQGVYAHPSADTRLQPGTAFIAMGLDEELFKLGNLVKDK